MPGNPKALATSLSSSSRYIMGSHVAIIWQHGSADYQQYDAVGPAVPLGGIEAPNRTVRLSRDRR